MKRPAFQFYPSDWRKDPELQSCGIIARGVWWEMLCLMHECQPYGHLARNGAPMPDESVANLIRVPLANYLKALHELEVNGVPSRTADGTIFSRRMVRDEHLRNVRAAAGKQGGNPVLLGRKVKQTGEEAMDLLNHPDKVEPTPSSASAFASSSASENREVRGLSLPVPGDPTPASPKVNGAAQESVRQRRNRAPGMRWSDMKWVADTAGTVEKPRRPNESAEDWKDRVFVEIEQRMRTAGADWNRRRGGRRHSA